MSGAPRARPDTDAGRLSARPGAPSSPALPGLHPLEVARRRDALVAIPAGYRADRPAPLLLTLHGAGGNAHDGLYPLRHLAERAGAVLVSPAARGRTWDVILSGFGPDVVSVDRALDAAFRMVAVDPARIAVAGFSDGASYAISLGITNGDLFRAILAFSPGFAAPAAQIGAPRIFVSHGTRDQVLPIEHTSRRLVPRLETAGYRVTYHEFDGGHDVPELIAAEALNWWLAPASSSPMP